MPMAPEPRSTTNGGPCQTIVGLLPVIICELFMQPRPLYTGLSLLVFSSSAFFTPAFIGTATFSLTFSFLAF